jgi:hypothetical protein
MTYLVLVCSGETVRKSNCNLKSNCKAIYQTKPSASGAHTLVSRPRLLSRPLLYLVHEADKEYRAIHIQDKAIMTNRQTKTVAGRDATREEILD